MRLSLLMSAALATWVYAAPNPIPSPTPSPSAPPGDSLSDSTSAVPAEEQERASAAAAFASMWRSGSQPPASTSTSAGPRGAHSWMKMIRKGNDCHVQANLDNGWLTGTSSFKIGTYDPKSQRCIYTGRISEDLTDHKLKSNRGEISYHFLYSRTVLEFQAYHNDKKTYFIHFPLSRKPGCYAWVGDNGDKRQYWADSRCHFDTTEWRDKDPDSLLSGWPHALDDKDLGSDSSYSKQIRAEPVNIQHLPAGLSSKGPPEYETKPSKKNFWVGLYQKDQECRLWLHNAWGNGADLSVPIGTFNAQAKKCENSKGLDPRRQIVKVAPSQFVTYYLEDEKKEWGKSRGVFSMANGTQSFFYPLGTRVGCQLFLQSSPDGKDLTQFVTKNCAKDLKKEGFILTEWDPKETTAGKSD